MKLLSALKGKFPYPTRKRWPAAILFFSLLVTVLYVIAPASPPFWMRYFPSWFSRNLLATIVLFGLLLWAAIHWLSRHFELFEPDPDFPVKPPRIPPSWVDLPNAQQYNAWIDQEEEQDHRLRRKEMCNGNVSR